MDNITMYMVTHKKVTFVPQGRTPIFVGSGRNSGGYLNDCTGDNISRKNKYYSELTALYWIWRNDNHSDKISIEHYRRFFSSRFWPKVISPKEVERAFENCDVIVSKKIKFQKSGTIFSNYKEYHDADDLVVLENGIRQLAPEYLRDYNDIMNGHQLVLYNMAMMKKEYFDAYCAWLFPILRYVEKEINLQNRDSYQQRVFGFLSERLLNVWLLHNKLRVKHLPIYYLSDTKLISKLKTIKHRFFTSMY